MDDYRDAIFFLKDRSIANMVAMAMGQNQITDLFHGNLILCQRFVQF